MNNQKFLFFFSQSLGPERIEWIIEMIDSKKCEIFLTEDAIFSYSNIKKAIENEDLLHLINPQSAAKRGIIGNSKNINFYNEFVRKLKETTDCNQIAYLSLTGPYMTNDALIGTELLNAALQEGIGPEFHGYLDGIHIIHPNQNPSEFTNVKYLLQKLIKNSKETFGEFPSKFCSRCATARGYFPESSIDGVEIVNLREIVERIASKIPMITYSCFFLSNQDVSDGKNELVIFLTTTPHNSEWMFGGLSLAIACANQGIEVDIVFIEDGVYAVAKTETSRDVDPTGFDVLNVINALEDTQNLQFYAYLPSLKLRRDSVELEFDFITPISENQLREVIGFRDKSTTFRNFLIF